MVRSKAIRSIRDEHPEIREVSPEVSVFWKPLRRLFDEGRPIEPVSVLSYQIEEARTAPFCAISKTRGDRLVLWPPSDALQPGEFADGQTFPIHHVTLELSSERTHFTSFTPGGQRTHGDRAWRLTDFGDGFRLWLITAFNVDFLEGQNGAVEQAVRTPSTDSSRRESEFRRYVEQMRCTAVRTPPIRAGCLATVFYLLSDSASLNELQEQALFPQGDFWNAWIGGWPEGDVFQIAPMRIDVGGVRLLLLTASLPKVLNGVCLLGSPSARS